MPKSKKKKPPSGLRSLSQLQLGLILIASGPIAYSLLALVWPLKPPYTIEEQGQLFGRGLASLLTLIVGIVMVVLHFVRKK